MPRALLAIFLVVFVDLLGFGIVIPILPYFAKTYDAGGWELGWLLTSYSLAQFIFSPFWGRLSDRYGRKPILLVSILGSALGMGILSVADSLEWLFLGRIVAGISAANISTAYAYATDITTAENRTKAMGLLGAAFGLGFTFGPAIGGLLAVDGFALPMQIGAGLAIINFFIALKILKEPQRKARPQVGVSGLRQVFRSPKSGIAVVLFFLFTFAVTQLETTVALHLGDHHDFSARDMGLLAASLGFLMVLIQGGVVGRLSKKIGEVPMGILAFLLCIFGFSTYGTTATLSWTVVALAFVSIGRGLLQPALSSIASFGATDSNRGITMGVFQSGASLARAIGPVLAGTLYDHRSAIAPFQFAAILCLVGLFLLIWKRRSLSNR